MFTGAGWNVIKVILARRMGRAARRATSKACWWTVSTRRWTATGEVPDRSKDGAYVREHFFGADPRLANGRHLSDDRWKHLRRGGHDHKKVTPRTGGGAGTVRRSSLAKTVKGWTLGMAPRREHDAPEEEARTRRAAPLPRPLRAADLGQEARRRAVLPPRRGQPEVKYLLERRNALGGCMPKRVVRAKALPPAEPKAFSSSTTARPRGRPSRRRWCSCNAPATCSATRTTASASCRSFPTKRARSAWKGMFRRDRHLPAVRPEYEPVDSARALVHGEEGRPAARGRHHRSRLDGVVHGRGHELLDARRHDDPRSTSSTRCSGSSARWTASGRSVMPPRRGFMLGATAGRTTLNGEGLQHEDGHSHLLASAVPNCMAYDPTWAYELARDHPGRPCAAYYVNGEGHLLPVALQSGLPAAQSPKASTPASSRASTRTRRPRQGKLKAQLFGALDPNRFVALGSDFFPGGFRQGDAAPSLLRWTPSNIVSRTRATALPSAPGGQGGRQSACGNRRVRHQPCRRARARRGGSVVPEGAAPNIARALVTVFAVDRLRGTPIVRTAAPDDVAGNVDAMATRCVSSVVDASP